MLRNKSARDPVALHLVRCLYFYSTLYQFQFTVEHVPGVLNMAADALSRNNLSLFLSLATPTPVPQALCEFLISNQPDWGSKHWIASFSGTWASR